MAVTIKISGDNLAFEAEATILQAARIIGFLSNEGTQSGFTGAPSTGYEQPSLVLGATEKRLSPRERLIQVNARTNPQKIVTLGQYIAERDATESFSLSDLKSIFGKAGEPIPRNLGRDVKESVRLGYVFADEGQSDHYVVTNKGLELLESGFSGETKVARKSNGTRKKAQPGKTSLQVNEPVLKLDVSDLLEGFPNYRSLSKKSDRLLWILAFAQVAEIDRLSAKDIENIADRLSDSIPARQVGPFTQTALKKGHISKSPAGYKVLFGGVQYLKGQTGVDDDE